MKHAHQPKNESICPIQDGDSIPMWMARLVYKRYGQRFGNSQSLERIIERGGFGVGEVIILLTELGLVNFADAKKGMQEFYPGFGN